MWVVTDYNVNIVASLMFQVVVDMKIRELFVLLDSLLIFPNAIDVDQAT